jgi:crotonobetainyl-CoA:carnitine CoA-transferase CaiB-like acyl-CoA transferase
MAGGLWAAVGILMALLERERTGRGQRVEASLLGGALSFLPLPMAHHRGGQPVQRGTNELNGGLACYNVYETLDGEYMTLAALEPEFWAEFCHAVGREDLLGQHLAPAISGEPAYEELRALFRSRTRKDWTEALAGTDACCDPVLTFGEALACPPVQALDVLADEGLLPPVSLSSREWPCTHAAPALGEHTATVLAEVGYDVQAVARLQAEGVV